MSARRSRNRIQGNTIVAALLITAVAYVFADNVIFQLRLTDDQHTQLSFRVRHAAMFATKHPPATQAALDITEPSVYTGPVDVRTGEFGNILPNGGGGKCRMVFLGGSTTESILMPERDRWPYLVGEHLNGVETYNFGVAGQNTHHSFIKYLVVIGQLKPDIVVVNEQINDIGKTLNGGYYAIENTDLYNSYTVSHAAQTFGQRIRTVIFSTIPFTSELYRKLTNRQDPTVRGGKEKREVKVDDLSFVPYFARLRGLKALVEAEGGLFILIHQPNRSRDLLFNDTPSRSGTYLKALLESRDIPTEDYVGLIEKISRQLTAFAKEHGILFLDAQSEWPKSAEHFYDDVHFSPDGSRSFAKYVSDKLRETVTRKCKEPA